MATTFAFEGVTALWQGSVLVRKLLTKHKALLVSYWFLLHLQHIRRTWDLKKCAWVYVSFLQSTTCLGSNVQKSATISTLINLAFTLEMWWLRRLILHLRPMGRNKVNVMYWRAACFTCPHATDKLARPRLAAGQPGYYVIQQSITLIPHVSGVPDGTSEMSAPYCNVHYASSPHCEHNVLNLPHIWQRSRFSAAGCADQSEARVSTE